jgi:hypothetical protein
MKVPTTTRPTVTLAKARAQGTSIEPILSISADRSIAKEGFNRR